MPRSYGVSFNEEVALRGLFLLDQEEIGRHAVVNGRPLSWSVDEALPLVDEGGEVCPANEEMGEVGLEPSNEGVVDFFSTTHAEATPRRSPRG